MRAAGLAALSWIVWTDFISYGFPWPVLTWGTLAVSAAFWIRAKAPRSIVQVIAEVEAEPRGVAAQPLRALPWARS
jgi:hypothetical protein